MTHPINYQVMPGLKYREPWTARTDNILNTVCDHYGISEKEIKRKCRKREIVFPRQVAIYLMKLHTHLSLKAIGEFLGGLDHTTVIYSVQLIKDLMATDKTIAREVDEIEQQLM